MKRKSPSTCQSYSLSPRSAKQISESFSANRHYNKRNSVHYVNLKQTIENWTELLFLKKVNIQNYPFSLLFPTVIPFHRVKKSPLIIGIVDPIKINSEQPLPFSESELSIPYFLQIVCMTYVCFVYFAAIAQVCIDLYTVMV